MGPVPAWLSLLFEARQVWEPPQLSHWGRTCPNKINALANAKTMEKWKRKRLQRHHGKQSQISSWTLQRGGGSQEKLFFLCSCLKRGENLSSQCYLIKRPKRTHWPMNQLTVSSTFFRGDRNQVPYLKTDWAACVLIVNHRLWQATWSSSCC